MKKYVPWVAMAVSLSLLGISCSLMCPQPPEGRYASEFAKHPFILEIENDRYEFHQSGPSVSDFPSFSGRCLFLEKEDGVVKVLGLTGRTDHPVIFFKIRKRASLLENRLEFSFDDKEYFMNGWVMLSGDSEHSVQAGPSGAPEGEGQ